MDRSRLTSKRDAVDFALRMIAAEALGLDDARALRGSGWEGAPDEMRDNGLADRYRGGFIDDHWGFVDSDLMHMEHLKLTARSDIEQVETQTRLFSSPPDGLHAAVAWEGASGESAVVFIWESAQASALWSQETLWPKLSAGELSLESGPPEAVDPIHVFIRGV